MTYQQKFEKLLNNKSDTTTFADLRRLLYDMEGADHGADSLKLNKSISEKLKNLLTKCGTSGTEEDITMMATLCYELLGSDDNRQPFGAVASMSKSVSKMVDRFRSLGSKSSRTSDYLLELIELSNPETKVKFFSLFHSPFSTLPPSSLSTTQTSHRSWQPHTCHSTRAAFSSVKHAHSRPLVSCFLLFFFFKFFFLFLSFLWRLICSSFFLLLLSSFFSLSLSLRRMIS